MIHVRREDLVTADVECLLRSVSANLDPLTAIGRKIGEAAGEPLLERLQQMGDLPVGGAAITPAGDLSASFLVHVSLQSDEEPVSASSVRKGLRNGLRHASRLGVETLALPPLGTGAGNLDAESAARLMFEVLREHMEHEEYPREVTVMVNTEYDLQAFTAHVKTVEEVQGAPSAEVREPTVD